MNLLNLILPPTYQDVEKTNRAGFLHYSLIFATFAFLVFGFLNLSWGALALGRTFFVFSGISLIGVILNKSKFYYSAATLLSIITFVGIFYNLIDGAALHDPGIAALPIFILLVGFLYRKRYIPVFTFFTVLSLIAIYALWSQALISLNQDPTINRVIILSVLQTTIGFITWIIISNYQDTITSLDASEKRLRVFFDDSPAMNYDYLIDPPLPLNLPVEDQIDWLLEKTHLLNLNQSYIESVQTNRNDLIGSNILESWAGDQDRIGRRILQDFIAGKYCLTMYETMQADLHGNIIWSLINAFGVIEGEHLTRIWGTDLDTTERKQSEDVLKESEERYRTLFENTFDVIFIMKETRIVNSNKVVRSMFGFAEDEIIGKHPQEFSPPRQPDGKSSFKKAERIFQDALDGAPQLFEWIHERKDGSLFPAEVFLHKVIIQGEDFMMAVIRDITERKKGEEAALAERQRLARNLHDAVSQTLWSASLIADVLPDIWQQDSSKGLERLGRLRQLTHGALAEMRSLLLELRPTAMIETKMAELLKQLVEATTSHSGVNITLDLEGDSDLPEDVHVTFYRIAQESLNNATRHAMASEIKIRLKCGPKYANLEIEDNGRGFDPENIPTGQHLGLQIMRERASSIDASLNIISQSGGGTKVDLIWTGDGEVDDG